MLKIYRVRKIFPQTMTESVNQLINDGGDCRTAPATPGLLNMKKDKDIGIGANI